MEGDAGAAEQEVEDLIQSLRVALEPQRPKSDSTIPLTLVQRPSGSPALPTLLSKAGPCKVLSPAGTWPPEGDRARSTSRP